MGATLTREGSEARRSMWAEIEQPRDSSLYEIEGKGLRECGFTELGQIIVILLVITSV